MKKIILLSPLILPLILGCDFLKHQAGWLEDKVWELGHKTKVVVTEAQAERCQDCEKLQFRIVRWVPDPNGKESRQVRDEKKDYKTEPGRFADPNAPFLTGKAIRKLVIRRGLSDYEIHFTFNEEGKNILKSVTALNLNNYVRISFNDTVISTGLVREPIAGGEMLLTYPSDEEKKLKEVFEKIRVALQSQNKEKRTVALVDRLPDEAPGTCGCFAWEGADRAKGKLIYSELADGKKFPRMKIGGKVIELQKPSLPVQDKLRSVTQGDWMEEDLSGAGAEVKSHWTAIEINSPAAESARTVNFNVRFSVSQAGETQSVGATGYCGCGA